MNLNTNDPKQFLPIPSSKAAAACSMAAARMSGEHFLELIRQRERYGWLADKVDRWVGLYSVPELVDLLGALPTIPGQHQKALVALSLTDDLSALAALEGFDSSGYGERFQLLHQVAIGQWRQRHRAGAGV
ncbi:MAG: hypothetical protein ACLFVJ_06550 [Persicimonas sp.]